MSLEVGGRADTDRLSRTPRGFLTALEARREGNTDADALTQELRDGQVAAHS